MYPENMITIMTVITYIYVVDRESYLKNQYIFCKFFLSTNLSLQKNTSVDYIHKSI